MKWGACEDAHTSSRAASASQCATIVFVSMQAWLWRGKRYAAVTEASAVRVGSGLPNDWLQGQGLVAGCAFVDALGAARVPRCSDLEVAAGRRWYLTSIRRRAASSLLPRDSAATAATSSPTKRTLPDGPVRHGQTIGPP